VKPERHLASHIFNVAVFVVGLGALAVMMYSLGWSGIADVFRSAGVWFAIIIGLDVLAMCCDAAAIHQFMRPEARMVSYVRVLAAQASGRAISLLTPGGALGEATKVTMLVGHAPHARVVSAIALFDLASLYLSVGILIVGVPLTVALVDLPHAVAVVVWTGLAVVIALVVALAAVIHRGAVGTALDALGKLRFVKRERLDGWRTKLSDIDKHLRELHGDRSPGTRAGFALVCVSRLLTWATTTAILHSIGVAITPTLLIGVFSCGVLVGWISAVVPFGAGIADGTNYALYNVLGATGSFGLAATSLDRARSVAVALLGIIVMGVAHTVNRISIARRHRHADELRDKRAVR